MKKAVRALAIIVSALALGACRLVFIVPQGGEVLEQIGDDLDPPAEHCGAQEQCTLFVSEPDLIALFYAVPHAGWKFAGWDQSQHYVCGPGRGSLEPENPERCFINIISFNGNPLLEAIVADDNVVINAAPIFVADTVGEPITDTVLAAGLEWAQPADFTGLSWEGINNICPGGNCGPGAVLRSYDMNGWTLASVDDLNALANHFLSGEFNMGPGPDEYLTAGSATQAMLYLELPLNPPIILATGPFRGTPKMTHFTSVGARLFGLTNTQDSADTSKVHTGRFTLSFDGTLNESGSIRTNHAVGKNVNDLETGAFFYRIP